MSERNVKKLVEFMAKSLVTKPEEVTIQETESSEGIILELRVATEDMGKVIGKQGRIAKAIRTVVKASTGRMISPFLLR